MYLTNALEPAQDFSGLMNFAIPALAHEAEAVSKVKDGQHFTVVIGNPPYSGHSANKGDWIRGLLRGKDGDRIVESYFEVDDAPLDERNSKWLNDDYVKFLRLAQSEIERTDQGIVGFITNHSYLDNPTFRGMRESLTETFSGCYLLDLHGNSKKKERAPDGGKDENVFDIQQGVSIGLFVKNSKSESVPSHALHADLWGRREGGKYDWLAARDVGTTKWRRLATKPPLRLFVPRDEELNDEYESGWKLNDVFPVNSVGIVTAKDKLAIQWTAEDVRNLVANFSSRSTEDVRKIYGLGNSSDGTIQNVQRDILGRSQSGECLAPILYRLFDVRFTLYTGKAGGLIERPRRDVMRHMLAGPNVGLITCRQQTQASIAWGLCSVSRIMIESSAISNKTREINYLFPLYTYPTEGQQHLGLAREPNLGKGLVEAIGSILGLEFISDGSGNLQEFFGPDDVFNYIYAVLHSPQYRHRYADFLKSDFPRVPLTDDQSLFAALVVLGKLLTALHLMESERIDSPAFPKAGDNRVDKVRYAPPKNGALGRVFINSDQYFEGVTPESWEFSIGSYRPAEKWLKDRKGRVLSDGDKDHYRRVVAALAETKRLMDEIDELIEQHGGWPDAFQ